METANIQSVVENNIVSVALMNIQPSSYNPRKHFDEAGLAELAWRLSECVYSFLQLLDFFVTHLAIEGKPKLALPKLMHTFKVLLVEVGITQKPIGDVFLVGPQVDAPSVQLAD